MKTRLAGWLLLFGVTSWLCLPQPLRATGACTAARFHDWNDAGCSPNYAGAGGAASGQSGAGGNQAGCVKCTGMPRWWVSEPYENLWISDTPLSYKTSSGQDMAFKFYYRQRYKLPAPDEVPDYYSLQRSLGIDSYYDNYARTYELTNAAWSHNWMMDIVFWNSQWEANYSSYYPFSFPPVFQSQYEALVFSPEGEINYFYTNSSGGSSLQDPRSQVRLQPLSALGYPTANTLPPDTNGIYWGDPQTNGFRLIYPDGSQDIFGFCFFSYGTPGIAHPNTTAHAFLTQRIDPQGRITRVGYEYAYNTNFSGFPASDGYRVRYVVDPDGRTNTFLYYTNAVVGYTNTVNNAWQLAEVDDPYGRKTSFGYNTNNQLSSITDAAGMTSSFAYQTFESTNTWVSSLITPYGTNSFIYYDVPDSSVTNGFQERAVCVGEPEGAYQLFAYEHTNWLIAATNQSPAVSGQVFDNGTSQSNLTPHYPLNYRNTFHWGRLQFLALTGTVKTYLQDGLLYGYPSYLGYALGTMTTNDYNKADLKHWLMLGADEVSITEALSSEQDPSPDAAGTIPGLRTWYNYPDKPSAELLGTDPQVSCIARVLPDSSSQYTTYNFYHSGPATGLASDNESTYSLPDGTVSLLTNRFSYAANGIDLTSVSNSAGQFVDYGYSTNHEITSITNSLHQVTTLSWQSNIPYDLAGIQFPSGQSVTLNYYPPVIGRYAFTNATTDLLKQISVQPEGRVFNIIPTNGLPGIVTDDRGLSVTNTWDGLNRLTSTTFPDGTTISNIYNRLDLTATKDRLGNWTYYVYDGLQHLTSVTNANQAVTSYSWCGCGSLESILDAQDNLTTLTYDNQGNLTNIAFPDYSSLTYQFDLAGRMTNAFDGAGRSMHLAYNNQGLATNVTGAYATLQSVTYDAVNRPIYVTDANGVTVTNQYDAINELLSRTWPDGISEGFGYSTNGLITDTNRDGQVTLFGRDGAERLIALTNANNEVTRFAYDSLDDITNLTDGLNHTTTWQYNLYGWLTNKVDGLSRNAFQFAYNADGWVTNRTTPAKGNTGYAYDNVGNLTGITYPSSSITYAYNLLNELTNMTDLTGTTKFSYTPTRQLQSESNAWATITYAYAQGLRTNLTIGSWNQSYGYDSVWRMTSLASPAGAFGYSYNFQPASPLVTGITLPNGASITNNYDSLARLTQTSLNNYWGHTLDGYSYQFDPLGLRTNITRNLGLTASTISVGYDNIQQITSWLAQETNGTARLNEQLGFGYDAADNLHLRTNDALIQTFIVDAANELTNVSRSGTLTLSGATPAPVTNITVNGQSAQTYGDFTFAATNNSLANGNNTFTIIAQNAYGTNATNILTVNLPSSVTLGFDANGNLTNDGTRSFAYDSENQLTNVMVAGQWQSSFVYDGLNRRRIELDYSWQSGAWVKTNEVHYIYDGYLPVQERDTNNNVLVTYTRGLDLSSSLQGAGGIGGLLARTDGNGSTYYHADGNGNITALMDGGENIVARYLYGPAGKLIGQWGSMANANTMQFSSMPWHDGLAFYPFRAYDPNLQRWLTEDPAGENGGINLYRAMNNNAVNVVDPYGLLGFSDFNPALLFNGQAWGQLGSDIFIGNNNSPAVDPNSIQALSQNAGYGFTPLTDANGNQLGNPATAVAGSVVNSLVTAATMMTPLGDEEAAAALASKAKSCPVKTPWGWSGGKPWKDAAKSLASPGTHEAVNGTVPTVDEARALLEELGVNPEDMRIEGGHTPPNPHTYPHINYPTPGGGRGTVKTQ